MKWFIYISFPIILVLNVFDVSSTAYLMDYGVQEANPIMNWLMNLIGVIPTLFLTKTIFLYILFEACCWYFEKGKDITKRETYFVIGAFVILITVYSYFMYTMNYQLLKLVV